MTLLREIYLESGVLSFAAWLGSLVILGAAAGVVVGALGMRVPRIPHRPIPKPSRSALKGDPK